MSCGFIFPLFFLLIVLLFFGGIVTGLLIYLARLKKAPEGHRRYAAVKSECRAAESASPLNPPAPVPLRPEAVPPDPLPRPRVALDGAKKAR